jgi:hypothetical protein
MVQSKYNKIHCLTHPLEPCYVCGELLISSSANFARFGFSFTSSLLRTVVGPLLTVNWYEEKASLVCV